VRSLLPFAIALKYPVRAIDVYLDFWDDWIIPAANIHTYDAKNCKVHEREECFLNTCAFTIGVEQSPFFADSLLHALEASASIHSGHTRKIFRCNDYIDS